MIYWCEGRNSKKIVSQLDEQIENTLTFQLKLPLEKRRFVECKPMAKAVEHESSIVDNTK